MITINYNYKGYIWNITFTNYELLYQTLTTYSNYKN